MRNFLYRMRASMARFMYGRNGGDQLCLFEMILGLVLSFTAKQILYRKGDPTILSASLYVASLVLLVLAYFRIFSKNLYKRREENRKFLEKWYRFKGLFSGTHYKTARPAKVKKDRKHYKYYTCPGCRQKLRVPKGKGKINIRCPKCGKEFIRRT